MNASAEELSGAKRVRLAVEKFADASGRQAKAMIGLYVGNCRADILPGGWPRSPTLVGVDGNRGCRCSHPLIRPLDGASS